VVCPVFPNSFSTSFFPRHSTYFRLRFTRSKWRRVVETQSISILLMVISTTFPHKIVRNLQDAKPCASEVNLLMAWKSFCYQLTARQRSPNVCRKLFKEPKGGGE
jgi:hypothetical protein